MFFSHGGCPHVILGRPEVILWRPEVISGSFDDEKTSRHPQMTSGHYSSLTVFKYTFTCYLRL